MLHVYITESADTDLFGCWRQREKGEAASFGSGMEGGERALGAFSAHLRDNVTFLLVKTLCQLQGKIIDLKLLQSQPIEK